jgi:outer membrane protein
MRLLQLICSLILGALSLSVFSQPPELVDRPVGDLGGAVYRTSSYVNTVSSSTEVLPYAYIDQGRFFARIDTFGIKTIPVGYGYLELAGRVNFEGFSTQHLSGLSGRKDPGLLGLGTYQETPIGGFFFNVFYDVNSSGGYLSDLMYAAELDLPKKLVVYPQLGLEYKSKKYTNYFYGVSASESAQSSYAQYAPASSASPYLGLMLEVPVAQNWNVHVLAKRKFIDSAIYNSPIVNQRYQDIYFLSLDYRFK